MLHFLSRFSPQPQKRAVLVPDESKYSRPEIQRIFDVIEKNLVTPEERAQMFEESHQEELKQTSFAEGREEARIDVARTMLGEGLDQATVARLTNLSLEQLQTLIPA